MHWKTRENITESLKTEILECTKKLSALLERNTTESPPIDPLEIYRTRSMLEARLNKASKDFEIWVEQPRSFL